jgi:hypothetical protein
MNLAPTGPLGRVTGYGPSGYYFNRQFSRIPQEKLREKSIFCEELLSWVWAAPTPNSIIPHSSVVLLLTHTY